MMPAMFGIAFLGTIVAAFALTFNSRDGVRGLVPLLGTLIFFATFAFRERRIRAGHASIHGLGERVALAAVWAWFILAFTS